ncbi:MAG: uracil phosphoribosyltransferase [Longimicrobiaceae bacterium]
MSDFPNLTVIDHPLVGHKLTQLRRKETSKKKFKELVDEIAMLMAYEATQDLPTESVEIETPLERTTETILAGKKLTIVPILRAGLGMVDGVARLVPSARVGHVGLYRDEETLEPVHYFFKIPPHPEQRDFLIVDPMLATGGSAAAAAGSLKERGAVRVRFMCLVAAPEGVRRMLDEHPDVRVFAAALDRELDRNGFIRPGLGDAGDRLFGTK